MAEATTDPFEQSDRGCGCKGEPSARAMLDRRYAHGEITREQYELMKQDIGGDAKKSESKKGCC